MFEVCVECEEDAGSRNTQCVCESEVKKYRKPLSIIHSVGLIFVVLTPFTDYNIVLIKVIAEI